MPMMSRNALIINVLPHRRKQIAAEAEKRRFFETLIARRRLLCCRPDPHGVFLVRVQVYFRRPAQKPYHTFTVAILAADLPATSFRAASIAARKPHRS